MHHVSHEARRTLCTPPARYLFDAPNDAVLRDAEDPHDIHLAAQALADQLGGEHPKGAAVVLGVLKHRLNAAEVCPLAIFAHNADYVADAEWPRQRSAAIMLGEWYLPPGECQVISTITEGTISISQLLSLSAPTTITQTPSLQADTPNVG